MAGMLDIFGAFKAGKTVANPAAWKNKMNLINSITVLLSAIATVYRIFIGELPISDDQIGVVAIALGNLLVGANSIVTTLTTAKPVSVIGIKPKDPESPGETK